MGNKLWQRLVALMTIAHLAVVCLSVGKKQYIPMTGWAVVTECLGSRRFGNEVQIFQRTFMAKRV